MVVVGTRIVIVLSVIIVYKGLSEHTSHLIDWSLLNMLIYLFYTVYIAKTIHLYKIQISLNSSTFRRLRHL